MDVKLDLSEYIEGKVLLVDKPLRMSSFDVIRELRRALRGVKMGHAGTLDPLATGLLIICTGKMTKSIGKYQDLDKEYEGSMFLGAQTPSFDLESEVNQTFDVSHVDGSLIEETTKLFRGEIEQRPPVYSAIKVDGKRAYKIARQGDKPEMPLRKVHINSFEILNDDLTNLKFRVNCSKGTYIRSLVHDFGNALKAGAYLSSLRRTAIGEHRVEDAKTPDQWRVQFSEDS